jgi:hypothetical protein
VDAVLAAAWQAMKAICGSFAESYRTSTGRCRLTSITHARILNHGYMERNFANFRRNSAVTDQGKPMARNFGVPMRSAGYQPGAFWPLLALALIVVGLISAVAHLR